MNNTLKIIIALLSALVLATFIKVFFMEPDNSDDGNLAMPTKTQQSLQNKSIKTVYVNVDTLYKYYEYFIEIKKIVEQKGDALEAEIKRETAKLEQEFMAYQQKAPTMSRAELDPLERSLAMKEEALRKKRENASSTIVNEQQQYNKKFRSKVDAYLKKYCKVNNIDFVLMDTDGSSLLYANDSLDITATVVKALNEAYKKEK